MKTTSKPTPPLAKRPFQKLPQAVFNEQELYRIFHERAAKLQSKDIQKPTQFVEAVVASGILKEMEIASEHYASKKRFIKPSATPFQVALSLGKSTFLSHASAALIHGIGEQIPKTIYVNREQSPKPRPTESPTQDRLDRAFAGRQRTSNYVFRYASNRIVMLNGKATGRFEVATFEGPSGERVDATTLARTLIDIAVRPAYAGGIAQVLDSYRAAKKRVSGQQLFDVLQGLDYLYPYHQTIGFLLERASFGKGDVTPFRKSKMAFDFYLVHGMREKEYVPEWRLYIPKGL